MLLLGNVKLLILSVEGEKTATLSTSIRGLSPAAELDENLAHANVPAGQWVKAAPNAQAAIISLTDANMAHNLISQAMLFSEIPIPQASLSQDEGYARVEMPRQGLSNVRLALSQVASRYQLAVVNEQNESLAYKILVSDEYGHQLIQVPKASGIIRIYQVQADEQPWLPKKTENPKVKLGTQEPDITQEALVLSQEPRQNDIDQSEAPVMTVTDTTEDMSTLGEPDSIVDDLAPMPNPTDALDAVISLTGEESNAPFQMDGLEQDVLEQTQAKTPTPVLIEQTQDEALAQVQPETTPVPPAPIVQGTAYFDFFIADRLIISMDKQTFNKNEPYIIKAEADGSALEELIRQEGLVDVEIIIGPMEGEGKKSPMTWNEQSQAFEWEGFQAHSGIARAQARAKVGNYFTIKSPLISYEIINQKPVGEDQPLELWVDDPFDPQETYTFDPNLFFTDADKDTLSFTFIDGETLASTHNVLVPGLAEFSIKEGQISFVPLPPLASPTSQISPMPEASTSPEAFPTFEASAPSEASVITEASMSPDITLMPKASPTTATSPNPEASLMPEGFPIPQTPPVPLGQYTLLIEAKDENDTARAKVDVKWFSVYEGFKGFSLDELALDCMKIGRESVKELFQELEKV